METGSRGEAAIFTKLGAMESTLDIIHHAVLGNGQKGIKQIQEDHGVMLAKHGAALNAHGQRLTALESGGNAGAVVERVSGWAGKMFMGAFALTVTLSLYLLRWAIMHGWPGR